jgi:hypothetical protein
MNSITTTTTTTTHFHGFDFAGWQVAAERINGGRLPAFFGVELSWPDLTIHVARWTVYIGRDRLTRAERKKAREWEAQLAWINADD